MQPSASQPRAHHMPHQQHPQHSRGGGGGAQRGARTLHVRGGGGGATTRTAAHQQPQHDHATAQQQQQQQLLPQLPHDVAALQQQQQPPPAARIVTHYTLGSDAVLEERVRRGDVVIARLRVYQRWASALCFARSRCLPRDVVVNTPELRGPALHNDVVALELMPMDMWQYDMEHDDVDKTHNKGDNNAQQSQPQSQSHRDAARLRYTRVFVERDDTDSDDDGGGSSSNDGDGTAAAAAPRPDTLPDGRRIVRCVRAEDDAAALLRQPPEVRLARQMHAPASYTTWPRGRVPIGRVLRVLWRELDAYQPAHLADNVLRVGQPVQEHFYYRFVSCNPLMPQFVVQGRHIPHMYRDKLSTYMLLLRLLDTADGGGGGGGGGAEGDNDNNNDGQGSGSSLRVYSRDMLQCTVYCSLGTVDSLQANNSALVSEFELPSETFTEDVEACVPRALTMPSADELARGGRRDLRHSEFVCTIDPATARDLDDALSIRRVYGRQDEQRQAHHGGTGNDDAASPPPRRVHYHVGVHIADVAHFVQPHTALDEEARQRGTSTYLVDRAIPMLPRKLSEDYCSLNPSEDKFAFSALFDLDSEGNVVTEWFGPSVIRSRCRLTYEQAQSILRTTAAPRNNGGSSVDDEDKDEDKDDDENKDDKEDEEDDDLLRALDFTREAAHSGVAASVLRRRVYASVRLLYEVAAKRRAASLQRGRITIGNTRLGFRFADSVAGVPAAAAAAAATTTATATAVTATPHEGDTHASDVVCVDAQQQQQQQPSSASLPSSFYVSRQIDANWLVEEFMLLANARVAEKVVQYMPDEALLRCHPPPEQHKMQKLKETLARHGVALAGTSAKAIMATMDAQRDNTDDTKRAARYVALCELVKFSLRSAEYVANGVDWYGSHEHYALGLPWYTHFTSPIRRYSDLLVHRQLRVALEMEQQMRERGLDTAASSLAAQTLRADGVHDHVTRQLLQRYGAHSSTAGATVGVRGGSSSSSDKGDGDDEDAEAGAPPRVANIDVSTLRTRACYYTRSSIEQVCEHLNERKERARRAGDASVEVYFCLYLRALAARARVDRRYAAVQCTTAVVLRLTGRSAQLFAPEIALSVQLSLKHASQRFQLLVPDKTAAGAEGGGGSGGDVAHDASTTTTPQPTHARAAAHAGAVIDRAAKAQRRSKGGKQNIPLHTSSSTASQHGSHRQTPTTVTLSWGVHPLTHEVVHETLEVLDEVVVSLHVTQQQGRMALHMIVLPPWERDIFRSTGATIPTALTMLSTTA